MSKGFDLGYRPSSYWGPQDLQKRYGSRIKGTLRNESVQSALEKGESVPDLLLEDELDPVVKKVKGQMHPWNMGGEYLPDFIGDEVEIARVVLQSTTMDTTSVRARKEKGSIVYRVVDEYMEDDPNKFVIPLSSSQKTLLMSQLIHIIDNVEDVLDYIKKPRRFDKLYNLWLELGFPKKKDKMFVIFAKKVADFKGLQNK